MSGNFAIKGGGGGVGRLMANAILNFHFDFLTPSLSWRRGQACFVMVFHAILRQISNYCFCAISLREFLSVLFFYAFSNYDRVLSLHCTKQDL